MNYGFFPLLNVKASYPQIASVELGTAYLFGQRGRETHTGPFVSYEPGINGQKFHFGLDIISSKGGIFDWVLLGGRLSASYFKPWREANGLANDENYYGVEVLGHYGIIVLSGGAYYGVEREKFLGSIGLGIGW
jgi:hypothetical protein